MDWVVMSVIGSDKALVAAQKVVHHAPRQAGSTARTGRLALELTMAARASSDALPRP